MIMGWYFHEDIIMYNLTIWGICGMIPVLPKLGISYFPQAKRVRPKNFCTSELLVGLLPFLCSYVFTTLAIVQLFLLGNAVVDPFNNF